jgi:hypothetical protein
MLGIEPRQLRAEFHGALSHHNQLHRSIMPPFGCLPRHCEIAHVCASFRQSIDAVAQYAVNQHAHLALRVKALWIHVVWHFAPPLVLSLAPSSRRHCLAHTVDVLAV